MSDALRVQLGPKRVRAFIDGSVVADSRRPTLVWEQPYYPTYYLPPEDVQATLSPTGELRDLPTGRGEVLDVTVDGRTRPAAAVRLPSSERPELRNAVRLDWDSMTAWFEEDEEVFTHARDPFTRVDILPSSRHVRVELDGMVVAESDRPWLVFETGLPTRYYLPPLDVRMDLLARTDKTTHCPYKGSATYWTIVTGERSLADAAWSYPRPLPESARLAGLVAFWPERSRRLVVIVDGERV